MRRSERALIAFAARRRRRRLLLERMERLGAVGVTSPTVGGYDPRQMFLDIGQGARVSTRVYDDELPRLRLLPNGRIAGWEAAARRAEDAPGDVVPGLLGQAVQNAGGRTAYVGIEGLTHDEAAAVADQSGFVDTVDLGDARGFGSRLDAALGRSPARRDEAARPEAGIELLEQLGTEAFTIVVRAPVPGPLVQLPTAASVGEGVLTSRTTRRDGMVAATDYAPTILDRLGIDEPDDMDGHVMEATPGDAGDVQSLVDRLAHVKSRRGPALELTFGLWLLVLAALSLFGQARLGLRLGLLTGMWLPGVALLTGALDPSRGVEAAALAVGSLALAFATDRAVRWPRAPAVPAAAVLLAHAIDLVAGSPLIVRSLAGPNPGFGARFFGIGNELEAILAVMVLLGAGALSRAARPRAASRSGSRSICAGRGALHRRGPAGGGRRRCDHARRRRRRGGARFAPGRHHPPRGGDRAARPALAVAALAALDLVTGGDAHLTRSVLAADSPGELVDVAERRFDISWDNLQQGTTPLSVGLFAIALAYGVARRRDLFRPLNGDRAFAAGMWGALAATVVGALANDSGPTIFLIGAAALVLAAGLRDRKTGDGCSNLARCA